MKGAIALCLAFAVSLVAINPATLAIAANAAAGEYNRANALYAAGQYQDALDIYKSIDTVHPALEYNRGAAYLRLDNTGKAALHFHRALRLDPGDPDTLANLKYINSLTGADSGEKPGLITRAQDAAIHALPLNTMSMTAIALYLICAALGLGVIVSLDPARKKLFVRALAAGLVVTTVWFGLTGARIYEFERDDMAVAIAESVDARSEPSETSSKVFTLKAGVTLKLGRVEGNYVFATVASGYSGWIDRAKVEKI